MLTHRIHPQHFSSYYYNFPFGNRDTFDESNIFLKRSKALPTPNDDASLQARDLLFPKNYVIIIGQKPNLITRMSLAQNLHVLYFFN